MQNFRSSEPAEKKNQDQSEAAAAFLQVEALAEELAKRQH